MVPSRTLSSSPLRTLLSRLSRRLPLSGSRGADTLASDLEAVSRLLQEAQVRALLADPRFAASKRLNRHEHQVFSQNGEDGMLQELFRRIGTTDRTFVEFGVGNGQRNNT